MNVEELISRRKFKKVVVDNLVTASSCGKHIVMQGFITNGKFVCAGDILRMNYNGTSLDVLIINIHPDYERATWNAIVAHESFATVPFGNAVLEVIIGHDIGSWT